RAPRRFERLQYKLDDEGWIGDRRRHLFTVSADGSSPAAQLTDGDFEDSAPAWSPDGRRIAFCSGRQEHWDVEVERDVFLVDAEGGAPERLTAVDCVRGQIVHSESTPDSLPEIYSGERKLTDVSPSFEAAEQERFTATSADGAEVEAWIMRPLGFEPGQRYPLLLNVHGGPFSQYGDRFFDEFQVQAGAGYAVLFSNPRGSSGYSEEWGRAIRGPGAEGSGWGSLDYEDVMAVMDEALER